MFGKLISYLDGLFEKKVILNANKGRYCVVERSNKAMGNLGEYLICDVGSLIDFDIKFLNDPEWPETQSNWCVLEKEGDMVRMFDFLTEERFQPYPVPDNQILRIKNSELQKLLYQWRDILLRDSLPRQIRITEKRGVFEMEAIE